MGARSRTNRTACCSRMRVTLSLLERELHLPKWQVDDARKTRRTVAPISAGEHGRKYRQPLKLLWRDPRGLHNVLGNRLVMRRVESAADERRGMPELDVPAARVGELFDV